MPRLPIKDQTSLRVCQSQGPARSATGHKALRAGESREGEEAGAWAGQSLQLVGVARVRWPTGCLGPGGPQGAPGSCEGPGVAVWGVSWPPGPLLPGAGGEGPARLCKPDRPVGPALRPRAVPQGRGVVLGATVSQVHTCRPSVYAPVLERMERPRGSLDTGSESRLRPGGGCSAGFPSGRQSRRATKGGAGKARGAGEGGSGEGRPGSLVLLGGGPSGPGEPVGCQGRTVGKGPG